MSRGQLCGCPLQSSQPLARFHPLSGNLTLKKTLKVSLLLSNWGRLEKWLLGVVFSPHHLPAVSSPSLGKGRQIWYACLSLNEKTISWNSSTWWLCLRPSLIPLLETEKHAWERKRWSKTDSFKRNIFYKRGQHCSHNAWSQSGTVQEG